MVSPIHCIFSMLVVGLITAETKSVEKPSHQRFEDMTTCEIIKYYDYPCEIHKVTTKDGYILEMHRIPHGKAGASTKGPVFLQHGLLDSSFTWVANDPTMSLAYLLAEDGFDVWLGNVRGNTYSRKHVTLKEDDQQFWDFSYDEFAAYDLPAMVDYALHETKYEKLGYIGHSQGTMIGFAAFGLNDPMLASKISIFAALAPVTHLGHMKGLLNWLSGGTWLAEQILKLIGTQDFLPSSWIIKKIGEYWCHGQSARICGSLIFMIAGFDTANLIDERLPIYVSHDPAGTSMKDIFHFAQNTKTDKFSKYDYGWNGNMKHYLQPDAPEYRIEDVRVPTALFVGAQDWLATPRDIDTHIRPVMYDYIVYDSGDIPNWNHMDFVWGKNANTLVYKDVIALMNCKHPDTGHDVCSRHGNSIESEESMA